MSRSRPPSSPDIHALLERERVIAPVTESVRARALARARAALIAGRVTAPVDFIGPPRKRWWMTVAIASVATAAVGATAYQLGAHRQPAAVDPGKTAVTAALARQAPPEAPKAADAVPSRTPVSPSTSAPAAAQVSKAPRTTQTEAGPDELRLLQRARAAVARHDFQAALSPIAEHSRRFREGRLAEEREALRVRALSGLGRGDDARRAADAFEARFPRSVLLPAVSHMPASRP
jgi:hypothetical protein